MKNIIIKTNLMIFSIKTMTLIYILYTDIIINKIEFHLQLNT
jgi:hypothetical protein